MRWRIAVIPLAVLGTVALAQEASRQAAKEAAFVIGAELMQLIEHGYDAVDPETRSSLAPTLAAWLESFRDDAVERGVEMMPDDIRAAFNGHLPPALLDSVRWRIDSDPMVVGQSLFQLGTVRAVTLDNVIVFADVDEATNVTLWAHELYHVLQYRQWGVEDFVRRYLVDRGQIEHDAREFRWSWMKATGRVPPA